ncbi:arginyltransferase [Bacteriovorax sp. Seq25_V]|uniref:arginyltransferase n=1 Tax=Bacteriovorax sp. Seq25_V TaxID=1201288 RepID=UPI000389E66F|nr:arginyltransferase [Bacteriovorax sp. Seq25_V]EQC44007.1 arginine-tRNA-protein transferase, C-terminal domain protein [Bacteriovorax sp. Seq25_V]
MKLLTTPRISAPDKCPYLQGQLEQHQFFFASEIEKEEMDFLLSEGWRKFGQFQFRPKCHGCQKCLPIRLKVDKFHPSKSQRKILKKNSDIKVYFSPLIFRKEHFALYLKHSSARFESKHVDNEEDFRQTFYQYTGTQLVSEFFLNDKMIAFGILEKGLTSLSSVYFVFDPDYSKRNLGTFGALKEIEYAMDDNLSHYYLGYWIEENKSMAYKSQFKPNQIYEWDTKTWNDLLLDSPKG